MEKKQQILLMISKKKLQINEINSANINILIRTDDWLDKYLQIEEDTSSDIHVIMSQSRLLNQQTSNIIKWRKNKQYHTVGTVPNFKIVETDSKSIFLICIYLTPHFPGFV